MRGLPFICLMTAALCALFGMALGIHMAIGHDYKLAPVHAHINLVGWVSISLYGLYYHAVPAAASMKLAKIHVAIAIIGLLLLAPGIALAVLGITEAMAAMGSIVTIAGMVLFAIIILRSRATTA